MLDGGPPAKIARTGENGNATQMLRPLPPEEIAQLPVGHQPVLVPPRNWQQAMASSFQQPPPPRDSAPPQLLAQSMHGTVVTQALQQLATTPQVSSISNAAFRVVLSSHHCPGCSADGKLSVYCVGCGLSGHRCDECGLQSRIGSFDPGNHTWYCRDCWIKNTPADIVGPFYDGDETCASPANDTTKNGDVSKKSADAGHEGIAQITPSRKAVEIVAAPSQNDIAKKSHWAQVFHTFQQIGSSNRALEYAQSLKKLRASLQDLFRKYKEGLSQEDLLLQNAYAEALEAYRAKQNAQIATGADQQLLLAPDQSNSNLLDDAYQQAIAIQVKAQQQVESEALELQKAVQGAHQRADAAQKEQETKLGRPLPKLPRRLGVGACKFFMKTGDCAYGMTCKWDHPTEKLPPSLLKPGSNQPGMEHVS